MNAQVWIIAGLAALAIFQVAAIPGLIRRRNDFADIVWGPAFPLSAAAAIYFGLSDGFAGLDARSWVLMLLLTVWALRLFAHVGIRNLSKSQEDIRYANWRKQWGAPALFRSWLQVFILQPVILYLFLSPVLLSLSTPARSWDATTSVGLGLWLVGFLFESIADEQLRRFKADPNHKGLLMTTGLWRYSRHPNYFGEIVQWWGLWVMVLPLPYSWLTMISPLGVTYLIVKISGVNLLEDLMRDRPGFAEYAARTSILIPWPERKNK